MDSQKIPILWNLLAAFLGAAGQLMYKKGGQKIVEIPFWQNFQLHLGILLFCGVMVCFVLGYKAGGKMSVVYPFYATTFFWATLMGFFIENEPFRWNLLLGSGVLLAGLYLISQSVDA